MDEIIKELNEYIALLGRKVEGLGIKVIPVSPGVERRVCFTFTWKGEDLVTIAYSSSKEALAHGKGIIDGISLRVF